MKALNHTISLPIIFGVLMLGFGLLFTALPLELYLGTTDSNFQELLFNVILINGVAYGLITLGMLLKQSWSRYLAIVFFLLNFILSNIRMLYMLFGGAEQANTLSLIAIYLLAQIFWISMILILTNKKVLQNFGHQSNDALKINPTASKIMIGTGVATFVWSVIALGSMGAIWVYGVMLGIALMMTWGGLLFLKVNTYNLIGLIGVALLGASIAPFMLAMLAKDIGPSFQQFSLYLGGVMLVVGALLLMRESWSRMLVSGILGFVALAAVLMMFMTMDSMPFAHSMSQLLGMGSLFILAIGSVLFFNQVDITKGFE